MNNPLEAILSLDASSRIFPTNSRYYGLETETAELPDGTAVVFVKRRFVPPADRFVAIGEHSVVEGDRPDNLAAKYFGDPELFWRLCDANATMLPQTLTETLGRTLRITLPEGIVGSTNA